MSGEGHPVVRVSKDKGEETLQKLKERGNLDPHRSIREEGDELIFPVKEGGNCSETDPKFREEKVSPYKRIKDKIDLPKSELSLLPHRWEMIGDILLIKLPDELLANKRKIAEVYSKVLNAKTVMLQGSIEGTEREPVVEKVYGEETETVHIENGVKFNLDVSELMFSSGNIDERIRMAKEVGEGEVVVDMFAGIGYFSLPMAVHGKPEKVYSLEINPIAFRYLKKNISLNEVEEVVKACLGDNRDFSFVGADRVVMGYLHETWEFLEKAVEFLDGDGIIHYHTRSLDRNYPEDVKEEIKGNIPQKFEIRTIKKIKSYAPHVFHVVADFEVYG